MNDDLYDSPSPGQPEKPEADAPQDEDKGEAQTYLVNKTAFPNAKPGDEIMARVVAVHDEEIECEPMEKEEHDDAPPESEMAGAPMGGGGGADDLMG